jgi:hypothetical protein
MPSSQYIWETSNSSVAIVNNQGELEALDLGECEIIVKYSSILSLVSVFLMEP